MSLLLDNSDQKIQNLAKKIHEKYLEISAQIKKNADDVEQQLIFDEIVLTLEFLFTAMEFEDDKIFDYYAAWIYQYLYYLDKHLKKEQIEKRLVNQYSIIEKVLKQELSQKHSEYASKYLQKGILVTIEQSLDSDHYYRGDQNSTINFDFQFQSDKHLEFKRNYLTALLNSNTKEAYRIIQDSRDKNIPLVEIYQDILKEVMYEVGELWHQNRISIDQEHYCTAVTQTILSNFYPLIFSQPPQNYKIVTGTVGSELHELGARMLSDLFGYQGWDSIYLGAAIPKQAIMAAIEKNQPDLVALSVTMPQHLHICKETVTEIKKCYPNLKVAVGGRAFGTTNEIWKEWDIDIYVTNADELVSWAKTNIVEK